MIEGNVISTLLINNKRVNLPDDQSNASSTLFDGVTIYINGYAVSTPVTDSNDQMDKSISV